MGGEKGRLEGEVIWGSWTEEGWRGCERVGWWVGRGGRGREGGLKCKLEDVRVRVCEGVWTYLDRGITVLLTCENQMLTRILTLTRGTSTT